MLRIGSRPTQADQLTGKHKMAYYNITNTAIKDPCLQVSHCSENKHLE